MQKLYNEIMKTFNKTKLQTVEELVKSDSFYFEQIKTKLTNGGFNITTLSSKQVVILFFALVDILFIVKDDKFYLVTMCEDKIKELFRLGRIIPRKDESSYYDKTKEILSSNTKDNINEYLSNGKFKFIKLNDLASARDTFFLCSLATMKPYPDLKSEKVYTMSCMSDFHNTLYNKLMSESYKIVTDTDTFVCQNKGATVRSLVTSGKLVTKTSDNLVMEIFLWKIKSYEVFSENDIVQKLLSGVCIYDGVKITLNRDILQTYYGADLYSKLESEGVRRRYCLEELLFLGEKQKNVDYYLKKYGLKSECKDIYSLQNELKEFTKKDKVYNSGLIHARILDSKESLLTGHKQLYKTINLQKVKEHNFSEVSDISTVLPKVYTYSAISDKFGYACVDINATSEETALKYGERLFTKHFGKPIKFEGLQVGVELIKGSPKYILGIEEQHILYNSIKLGYTNFNSYKDTIYSICRRNKIAWCTDEHIKFVFINQLAMIKADSKALELSDVIIGLIDFLNKIKTPVLAQKSLNEEYLKIAVRRARLEFKNINNQLPSTDGYYVQESKDGKFIKTDYARFKVLDNKLSTLVEVYFYDKFLCKKRFK